MDDTLTADEALDVALDDVLLDTLGSALPAASDSLVDDELSVLLLAWRREAETKPFDELTAADLAALRRAA